ncbi:MAG TPA: hypothetical protein DCP63_13080 [Bacteroidetes bacterium]|nr:hypothetical protein [Bacteroidota bacterium]
MLRFLLVIPLGFLSAQESGGFDTRLFRDINNRQTQRNGFPELLDKTTVPTFAAIPAGLFITGYASDDDDLENAAVLLGAAQVVALGTTSLLKAVIDRRRPFETLPDVKVKDNTSSLGSSFPSGHTSQAFAIATLIALEYPKPYVYVPAFIWAGLVGYGRIYLGVHYPSDVLGGLVLGTVSAILVWSFRDGILDLKTSVLGSNDVNSRVAILPPAGAELLRIRIRLN